MGYSVSLNNFQYSIELCQSMSHHKYNTCSTGDELVVPVTKCSTTP